MSGFDAWLLRGEAATAHTHTPKIAVVCAERQSSIEGFRRTWSVGFTTDRPFAEACDAVGIAVRPFDGEGARVSIGTPAANDAFLAVASAFPQRG